MKTRNIVFVLIILAVTIGTAGYIGFNTTKPVDPVVQAPQTVTAATCDVEQSVAAPGRLINTLTANIEMPVTGKLDQILASAGDSVTKGQVLANVANQESLAAEVSAAELEKLLADEALNTLYRNAQAKLAQLKVDLLNAQSALSKAETKRAGLVMPRAADTTLERAEGELVMAEDAYKEALKYYQSKSELGISDPERMAAVQMLAAAKNQYDQAKANLAWYQGKADSAEIAKADAEIELARATAAAVQASLDRLQNGVDPIEEAQAKAKLSQAEAKLAQAKLDAASAAILAPFNGVVLEVKARSGETIHTGDTLFILSDPQALQVKANITQEDYPLVSAGQRVELYFDARPELTIHGKIASIIPMRVEGDRPLYTIYISLDEIPAGLVDGMTTDAAITIARREGVLCLPRAVVRASGANTVNLKIWDGAQVISRQVEVGLRGDTYIEILSGLKAGEQVVTK